MVGRYFLLSLLIFCGLEIGAQEITQYTVFAGRYDYVAFGNTLNLAENGDGAPCEIATSSAATLSLETDQTIEAAYLYWAGSGTGDFEVTLNDIDIIAQRTFADAIDADRPFFAAFTNITDVVSGEGPGEYTLSNLDLTNVIPQYCATGTNFAGWSIIVVYEDNDLPLNQVNVFDGLESVSSTQNELNITLENLNVLDNNNAKIGFIAWEGDAGLAVDETLSINGTVLSNPPLNPANNQFNGTNSFTEQSDLYNMDIDVYGIENNIEVGDTEAVIQLTSGQDFVMINAVVTVLNSQLPDAICEIDDVVTNCNSQSIEVTYTITNQGTDILPLATPISFYANDQFIASASLEVELPPEIGTLQTTTITIPDGLDEMFNLAIIVDDDGTGQSTVIESNENNNIDLVVVSLNNLNLNTLDDITICDSDTDGIELVNLEPIASALLSDQDQINVTIYISEVDAINQQNAINGNVYTLDQAQQQLFFRFDEEISSCFAIETVTLFLISPPEIEELSDIEICDDTSNDGIATFDLTIQNENIIDDPMSVTIDYYLSNQDAESAINQIASPGSFTNTQNPQEIFIRVTNDDSPQCNTIASFIITVTPINDTLELPGLTVCNEGFELGTYDLTQIESDLTLEEAATITGYFLSESDASTLQNQISDPFNFASTSPQQTVFVRTESSLINNCYQLSQFNLSTENCPPYVPEGFSPNGDAFNNTFEISGLKDIYINYQLLIYTRLGNLVYQGDNDTPFWNGVPNRGIAGIENPTGVYYWVLYLNDPKVKDMTGWVYLNR